MPTIRVTFEQHFPTDMVSRMLESEFMGLCASLARGEDVRTLVLQPTAHEYRVVKAELQSLQEQGALSFSESAGNAP